MDFIQHLQIWTKGEVTQGKWMIAIAFFILLPIAAFLMKSNHSIPKGMFIPISLLFFINAGYGTYLLFSKPKYEEQRTMEFKISPEETLINEIAKTEADHKSYTFTKYLWAALLIVSVICFFVLDREFLQGLSVGFAVMFIGMLVIDIWLHYRLKCYLIALNNILN